MPIDPVCPAIVDEDGALYTSEYNNQKYYFCCNYCRKQFEEKPSRYTRIAHDICVDPYSSHNRI
jgi:YHS domain-containing protein